MIQKIQKEICWGASRTTCVCAKSLQLCPTFCEPMDYNPPGSSLSVAFSRQEYWSGLPCPSPGDLLNPGIKPVFLLSPALASRYFTTRQHIKKQRHYFTDKGLSSQSYVFSVVMYGCESWTIKKAQHWRIDDFELWCWRRLLRVPWTARRSNQSLLEEIYRNI